VSPDFRVKDPNLTAWMAWRSRTRSSKAAVAEGGCEREEGEREEG